VPIGDGRNSTELGPSSVQVAEAHVLVDRTDRCPDANDKCGSPSTGPSLVAVLITVIFHYRLHLLGEYSTQLYGLAFLTYFAEKRSTPMEYTYLYMGPFGLILVGRFV
jgi:hypothetical protein